MNLRLPFDPGLRTPVVRFAILLVAAAALATAGVAQTGLQGSHDAAAACLQRFTPEELLSHGERIAHACAAPPSRSTHARAIDAAPTRFITELDRLRAAARAVDAAPTRFTTRLDRLRAAGHAARVRQNAAAANRETASQ